jgi:hypothetical protein
MEAKQNCLSKMVHRTKKTNLCDKIFELPVTTCNTSLKIFGTDLKKIWNPPEHTVTILSDYRRGLGWLFDLLNTYR